jgi:hypothetical protein
MEDVQVTEADAAQITAIAAYLQGLDGAARTPADIIELALGMLLFTRPDIAAAQGVTNG